MTAVSVITPAFRPSSFAALERSMANNRDVNAEWIVIDDGSGPAYDAVFATLDGTGVQVLRQARNRRQGAARNAGLAQASGLWVKFLDADDRLDEGHLATLLAAAEDLPETAISFAPTRHVFPGGRIVVNDSWHDLMPEPQAQLARLLYAPFLHHCGALFPRALLAELGGYDETLVTDEDGDLLIRVLMAGQYFAAVPEVQYHYIHHGGSGRVSSDVGGAKLAARLRVCAKVEEAYAARDQEMPDAVRSGLARRLDKIAFSYWKEDRATARTALERAQALSPGYVPDIRAPLRILRKLGGPGAVLAATALYRWIRRRPAGGTQG